MIQYFPFLTFRKNGADYPIRHRQVLEEHVFYKH